MPSNRVIKIENIIEQPNIDLKPEINIENKIEHKPTKKKVIRDKDDKVIGIEETIQE